MPAIYAHDRFGEKVAKKLGGELKRFVFEYYPQFEIGLQGPDIFFFYRPYTKNRVVKYGNQSHNHRCDRSCISPVSQIIHFGYSGIPCKIIKINRDNGRHEHDKC